MSPSNRGSRWSNSGMVVEIRPEDYSELVGQEELYLRNGEKVDADSPLALMAFQERLEEVCWLNGGMKQTAPASAWMISCGRRTLSIYRFPRIRRVCWPLRCILDAGIRDQSPAGRFPLFR